MVVAINATLLVCSFLPALLACIALDWIGLDWIHEVATSQDIEPEEQIGDDEASTSKNVPAI